MAQSVFDINSLKIEPVHSDLISNMIECVKENVRDFKLGVVFFLIGTSCPSMDRCHEFLPVIHDILKEPESYIVNYDPEIELNIYILRIDPEYIKIRPVLPKLFEGNKNLNQWDTFTENNIKVHICTMAFNITDTEILDVMSQFNTASQIIQNEIGISRMLMSYMNFSGSGITIYNNDKIELLYKQSYNKNIHTLTFSECLSNTNEYLFYPISKLKENGDFEWLYISPFLKDENINEVIRFINDSFSINLIHINAVGAIIQSFIKMAFYMLDALVCKLYPYVIFKDEAYNGEQPFNKRNKDLQHNIEILKHRFGSWISGLISHNFINEWMIIEDMELIIEDFIDFKVKKIINIISRIEGGFEKPKIPDDINAVSVRLEFLHEFKKIYGFYV